MVDPAIPRNHTLSTLPTELLQALQQPFASNEVCLCVGQCRQTEKGSWECVALPMLKPQAIESRLDRLVPGEWSTTSPSLVVAHDRLVVAAQVQIGAITHTDYGELSFKQASLLNESEELIWSVPEAFEQAFLKVCARFGLGRYLANLAREWVLYDMGSRSLALSPEQQHTHILKLYQQAGIALPLTSDTPGPAHLQTIPASQTASTAPRIIEFAGQETLRAKDIAWIRQQCASHPGSLAKILKHWKVEHLEDLSDRQVADVINSIHASRTRAPQKLQQAS